MRANLRGLERWWRIGCCARVSDAPITGVSSGSEQLAWEKCYGRAAALDDATRIVFGTGGPNGAGAPLANSPPSGPTFVLRSPVWTRPASRPATPPFSSIPMEAILQEGGDTILARQTNECETRNMMLQREIDELRTTQLDARTLGYGFTQNTGHGSLFGSLLATAASAPGILQALAVRPGSGAPQALEASQGPGTPQAPRSITSPGIPQAPGVPQLPGIPQAQAPGASQVPGMPQTFRVPQAPEVPQRDEHRRAVPPRGQLGDERGAGPDQPEGRNLTGSTLARGHETVGSRARLPRI